MKKALFLTLTAIVSSVMILGSLTDVVKAASIYDDVYRTTNTLLIPDDTENGNIDISTRYQEILDGNYPPEWGNFRFGNRELIGSNISFVECSSADEPCGRLATFLYDWKHNKQAWSISNDVHQFGSSVKFCYSNTFNSPELYWNPHNVGITNVNCFSIIKSRSDQSAAVQSEYLANAVPFKGQTNISVSEDTGLLKNFITYINPSNYDYPPDYDGAAINDSFTPRLLNQTQFDWTVKQSGAFDVRYAQNLPFDLAGYLTLETFKCNNDFEFCNDVITPEIKSEPAQTARWHGSYPIPFAGEFKLPSEGNFLFRVLAICPIGSDGCENNSPSELTVGAAWQVKWDGKTFITGSTDPAAGFSTWDYSVNPVWQMLDSASVPTFGLQAAVLAPLTFLQDVVGQLGNCQPIVLPKLVIFEFEFECLSPVIKSNFPQVVLIYQTVLTAMIFYYIFIRFFGLVKDAQDPGKNKIEVMKL